MAVNLYEIEDTSFWLGTPTRLETIKHYASMLEEDIQYLKRQLLAARDNISTLAEMNDQLNTNLQKHRKRMAKVESETTDQLAEIQSLSMVRD
jgi:regulator of replication initiation timing